MEEPFEIKNTNNTLNDEELAKIVLDIARTMIKKRSLCLDVEFKIKDLFFNMNIVISEKKRTD